MVSYITNKPRAGAAVIPIALMVKQKIKVAVIDTNDKAYNTCTEIDVVELDYAQIYNPSFGKTLDPINEQQT